MPHESLNYTPPITRVHNLLRIRTVVNSVTRMNLQNKYPSDDEIGRVLAETGLSKLRTEKIRDRIMRRARDHLLTASYMGLLSRFGRPFGYVSTTSGKFLNSYSMHEECPKDILEEAVFIDRIMRLKLTNVYDLQSKGQYRHFRTRPCLLILSVLSDRKWMHEHMLAIATGGKRHDPAFLSKNKTTPSFLSEYKRMSVETLQQFYSDFNIKEKQKKNMTRNIRPLLDWCESLGLIESSHIEDSEGRWYSITERGIYVLGQYKKMMPIWFQDLGDIPSAKAAILLFYIYGKSTNRPFTNRLLDYDVRIGLTKTTISEIIDYLQKNLQIKFTKDSSMLETNVDFTLEYDVPPEERENVASYITQLSRLFDLEPSDVLKRIETFMIESLSQSLDEQQKKMKSVLVSKFSKRTEIDKDDPILKQVGDLIPSVGILNQYRSDFEKEVVILLRLMGLNAVKYQGQLAQRCYKNYVMRFFENNPDILIINDVEVLVECKSLSEWRSPIRSEKAIQKEILIYQQYLPEVRANSVGLVYEGTLDKKSRSLIRDILRDSKNIVFINKNFLINCAFKHPLREKLIKIIKEPDKYDAEQRILIV